MLRSPQGLRDPITPYTLDQGWGRTGGSDTRCKRRLGRQVLKRVRKRRWVLLVKVKPFSNGGRSGPIEVE